MKLFYIAINIFSDYHKRRRVASILKPLLLPGEVREAGVRQDTFCVMKMTEGIFVGQKDILQLRKRKYI